MTQLPLFKNSTSHIMTRGVEIHPRLLPRQWEYRLGLRLVISLIYESHGSDEPQTFDFNFHLTTTHNSLATSQCYEGSHSSPRCLMSRVFSRRMNSPQPLCVAPDVLTLNPYEVASDLPDGLLDMSAGDSPVLTATNAHNVPLPEATEGEYIAHKPTTRPSHDGEENIIDDETLIRRGNATGGPVQISLAPSSPVPSAITSRKVRSRLYRERASRPLLPRLDKTRSSKGSCGQSKTSALTSETFNADQPEPLDHDNSNSKYRECAIFAVT